MATARTVKDVSPHEFVKGYAAHLKRSGKVFVECFNLESSAEYVM
ncbi:putative ribosomal protein S19e [Helianthus anomalus]